MKVYRAILLVLLLTLPSTLYAQTCPQPFTIRQEACPGGVSTCTSKGSTLTYQELDRDLLNTIGLCDTVGRYTWPAPSTGIVKSNGSGVLSLIDSSAADFLKSGALTCGAGTQGKIQVHTTPLQYCDNSATPTLRYGAYGDNTGAALFGDSATAFFSSGTVESTFLPALSGMSGAVTDAQVPNTITIDLATLATTATALAANGANCSAGNYPLGVNASGAVETCTADDDVPESGDFTNLALTGDVTSSGLTTTIGSDKILESMLKSVNAPTDEFCLTYESTTGDFEWQTCGAGGGSGDVVGPASATDNAIARFDTTTGKLLQNSSVSVSDLGMIQIGGTSSSFAGLKSVGASAVLNLRSADDSTYGIIDGDRFRARSATIKTTLQESGIELAQDRAVCWAGNADATQSKDGCLARSAAGLLKVTDGGSGDGSIRSAKSINAVQSLTVADNGTGARATSTLTPTTSYVSITCNDTNGCDITLSETGAVDGQILRIVCMSANVCGFVDTAGVSELAGIFDLGQYDSLSLVYASDRWIETARSNN